MKVGDSNGFGQAFIDKDLESLVSFLDGSFGLDRFSLEVDKAGRIRIGFVNVFESNREVDKEEIKVVDTPPFELCPRDGLNTFLLMESIPQLRGDEQIRTLDEPFINSAFDSQTGFFLISIILVSRLDI